ncbi:hypothetical protein M3202_14660 [Alkalihalobacillus oceani]|uniref:Uncharacterized protein n=1 Tax=Halalkalibacter oceani TaxID=1653776 RepID=A0A9X2IPJ6_9BACI|nr:hypothetical protein [Halalkalibacter oceani]MCM3715310.1 hypothetical protein [Halalkalibacter oceani]
MLKKIVFYTGASFASLFVVPTLAILIPVFPILGIGLAGYTILHVFGMFPSLPLVSLGVIPVAYPLQIITAFIVSGLLLILGIVSYKGLKKYIRLLAKRKEQANY